MNLSLAPSYVSSDPGRAATDSSRNAITATDGELLMRFARHRDSAAFAQIVERHGGLVWIVCREVLGHRQDVEDAFQATFFILAERASKIRSCDSAAAWLYKVAQRTSLAARRKRARRREEELNTELPQDDEARPLIHDQHMIYVLLEELRGLPERYQSPLVMRYLEGRSRRAIAMQTDSTIAQIQGRLVRGRRLLRSRLARRGVSLSLAAGAMASASAKAAGMVTPLVAAATAKSCLALKTTGAVGGVSATALELAKQGAQAMWLASLTKITATASATLVVAGIAWGVQAGGASEGGASAGPGAATVELQGDSQPAANTVKADAEILVDANDTGTEEVLRTIEDVEVNRPNRASNPDGQIAERKLKIEAMIAELQKSLEARIEEKAAMASELEMQQLEKSLQRQQLEQAHSALLKLDDAANSDDSDSARKKRSEVLDKLKQRIAQAQAELKEAMHRTAKLSAAAEHMELKMSGLRRALEEIERMQIQMEFAPAARAPQGGADEFGMRSKRAPMFVDATVPQPTTQALQKENEKLKKELKLLKAKAEKAATAR
jgi:RNA polymerase sigma factor (sigma-70 family)